MLQSFGERLAAEHRETRREIAEVANELGSSRDPSTIRGRLHALENDRLAMRIAREAAAEARQAKRQGWSDREKLVAAIVGLYTAALATIATLAAVGWLG